MLPILKIKITTTIFTIALLSSCSAKEEKSQSLSYTTNDVKEMLVACEDYARTGKNGEDMYERQSVINMFQKLDDDDEITEAHYKEIDAFIAENKKTNTELCNCVGSVASAYAKGEFPEAVYFFQKPLDGGNLFTQIQSGFQSFTIDIKQKTESVHVLANRFLSSAQESSRRNDGSYAFYSGPILIDKLDVLKYSNNHDMPFDLRTANGQKMLTYCPSLASPKQKTNSKIEGLYFHD